MARLQAARSGGPAKVIATGGLATLFDRHTSVFDAIEPDLTIQGIALIARAADLVIGISPFSAHVVCGRLAQKVSPISVTTPRQ